MSELLSSKEIAEMATKIVSAYVSHNSVPPNEVPEVIRLVANDLRKLEAEQTETPAQPPAVPIRSSVGKDYVTCLICGKRQKTLKRHLAAAHGVTSQEYREMFGLKASHPLVAPNYSKRRSQVARDIGLGQPRKPSRGKSKSRTKAA